MIERKKLFPWYTKTIRYRMVCNWLYSACSKPGNGVCLCGYIVNRMLYVARDHWPPSLSTASIKPECKVPKFVTCSTHDVRYAHNRTMKNSIFSTWLFCPINAFIDSISLSCNLNPDQVSTHHISASTLNRRHTIACHQKMSRFCGFKPQMVRENHTKCIKFPLEFLSCGIALKFD